MTRILALLSLLALCAAPNAHAQTLFGSNFRLTTGPCTIRSGSGAPATSLGVVCDTYHRTDAPYTLYKKVAAAQWIEVHPPAGTAGDLVYGTTASALGRIAPVASGSVLASAGIGNPPAYTATPTVTSLTTPSLLAAANMTITPAGDLVLAPTGNDILPNIGYTKNLGAIFNKYLTVHAAELWVTTLVAQDTIATIGGRVLVGPTTTLTADLVLADSSITVKHNQMVSGDRVYMEADGKVEFMTVTGSPPTGSAGAYVYPVARNQDGSGANDWFAGDAVFNTGGIGDGFIDLYSVRGVITGTTAGPTIVMNARTGNNWFDIQPRAAFGNLNGLYGYGADTYGVGLGDTANAWVKIDPTNGVRIGEGANTYFSVDPAGNALFAGQLTIGTGRNQLANSFSAPTVRPETNDGDGVDWGVLVENHAGTAVFGCNLDNWRLETPGGVPTSGSCYAGNTGTPLLNTVTILSGPTMPVQTGLRYEWSFYCGNHRGSFVSANIVWLTASGTYISEVGGAETCSTQIGGVTLATWGRASAIAVAPALAVYAQPRMVQSHSGSGEAPSMFAMRLFFAEAQTGQTVASPWASGGLTQVTGDYLSTDLVMANTLRSSGAANFASGTGFWLDATTGTPTFRVGDPLGNRLSWDGFNVVLGQGSLRIDSSGISLAPGASNVWVPGQAYRFTATNSALGTFAWDSTDGSSNRNRELWLVSEYLNNGSAVDSTNVRLRAIVNDGAQRVSEVVVGGFSSGATTTGEIRLVPYNNGEIDVVGYLNFEIGGALAASGGSATLPANPCAFVTIRYNGLDYLLPAYAVSGQACVAP